MVVPPLSKTLLQVNFFGEESLEEKAAVFQPLRNLGPVLVGFCCHCQGPCSHVKISKLVHAQSLCTAGTAETASMAACLPARDQASLPGSLYRLYMYILDEAI